MKIKQCIRCGKRKPISEFGKNKRLKDGYKSHCKDCGNKYNCEWAKRRRKNVNRAVKKYYHKLRLEILIHYGGNPPKCACCGESHIEFLTLDHIHGGGNKERKKYSKGGSYGLWLHLRKSNFPEGYRVLCMNCNHSIGHYSYCPHKGKIKCE